MHKSLVDENFCNHYRTIDGERSDHFVSDDERRRKGKRNVIKSDINKYFSARNPTEKSPFYRHCFEPFQRSDFAQLTTNLINL